jgi:uncharacterized protein
VEMVLNLCEMRGSEESIDRIFAASKFASELGDDYAVTEAVTLRLRLHKDGANYRLVGTIGTLLRLECSRCVELFDVPVTVSVDLMYLPHRINTGDGVTEITDEDLATAFYRDEQIDLGLMIREQLQLSLSMKPLCRDTCRGLCPICGINLNSEGCSCGTSWQDPRLAPLAALRSESGKG